MDKSWMELSTCSRGFREGLEKFLDFAFANVGSLTGRIPCPCTQCVNGKYQTRAIIREHLIINGFMDGYTHWFHHGEDTSTDEHMEDSNMDEGSSPIVEVNRMPDMVNDIFMSNEGEPSNEEAVKFQKYMDDATQPLYPACETETVLSFTVWLFNHKCVNKWSDISVDGLICKLKKLPLFASLPDDFYEIKKMVGDLGFSYEKIDACPNDCMIYWKEESGLDSCKICKTSRWEKEKVVADELSEESSTKRKKVAAKQLRYMPVIPRLRRLFKTRETAEDMRWHHEKRRKDGVNRHPADSDAWQHFDALYPSFSGDSRNIRLGYSTDGMNPFKHGKPHSIWPVTLVVYNLPPWKCMKLDYFLTPLLIPGPNSPGNNIDVYFRPLIEELKMLWTTGVQMNDASKNEKFTLRAAVLWTISDFPALGYLFGWVTKGYLACPVCLSDTRSQRIRGKECYTGHRCFLELDHKYRADTRRFNGKTDYSNAPVVLTGFDELEQVQDINVTFGMTKVSTQTVPHEKSNNWRKKNIFIAELPYWRTLLVRHCLDLMHIEKNVCDNLIGTLLGLNHKTKDNLKSRFDLVDLGIRKELHPKKVGDHYELPAACYTMSKEEKRCFLEVLKNVKVPDGYSSNISRCVNVKDCKISGLKSHDCHILMQQLLPVALRASSLPPQVISSVIALCSFFKELSSSHNKAEDYERLSQKIPLILCNLEMVFPPSFFDIMIHLPVHLAEQARIAGNPKFWEMWGFERQNYKLKGYIRNRAHPEGSIAEGIIVDECLTFCTRYLEEGDSLRNRGGRNDDGYVQTGSGLLVLRQIGKFIDNPKVETLDSDDIKMAHLHVLYNCDEVEPYLSIWEKAYLLQRGGRKQKPTKREIDNAKKKLFPTWFKDYIKDTPHVSKEVNALACGPNYAGRRGHGYLVNGYRFHTESRERRRKTQNSGVYVGATTRGYASAKDRNPKEDVVEYFGILEDIIEIDYFGTASVVLFKCKWYDSLTRGRGVKSDNYGFTLVNSKRLASTDEPFVMPSQVEQIFYVDDQRQKDWRVVVRTKPRGLCENAEADSEDEDNPNLNEDSISQVSEVDIDNLTWTRNDVEVEVVGVGPSSSSRRKRHGSKLTNTHSKRRKGSQTIEEDDSEKDQEEEEVMDEDLDEQEGIDEDEEETTEDEEEGDEDEDE